MHISIGYPHTLFRPVDNPAIPVHSSDEETDGCFRIVSCFTDLQGSADIQCKVQKDPTSAVQNSLLVLTLRKCVVCNQEGRQMVALVFEDHNSVGGLFKS